MTTRHRRLRAHLVDAFIGFGLGALGAAVTFGLTAWLFLDLPLWP